MCDITGEHKHMADETTVVADPFTATDVVVDPADTLAALAKQAVDAHSTAKQSKVDVDTAVAALAAAQQTLADKKVAADAAHKKLDDAVEMLSAALEDLA